MRGLGLSVFQLRLSKYGGLGGIGSRFQGRLFEEVSPALVAVGGTLSAFKILQRRFCVLPSLDHLDHSRRLVSANVVANYHVRCLDFVVCQMCSLFSRKQRSYSESMREGCD